MPGNAGISASRDMKVTQKYCGHCSDVCPRCYLHTGLHVPDWPPPRSRDDHTAAPTPRDARATGPGCVPSRAPGCLSDPTHRTSGATGETRYSQVRCDTGE